MNVTAPTAAELDGILWQPAGRVRALQDRLLRRTIELCYDGHPHYARLMRAAGLRPQDIRSVDDLPRLPPTRKEDFLADPDAFRLRGEGLTAEEATLWQVMYTTGTTTGVPAPVYVTTYDRYAYLDACTRREDLVPLQAGDVIASLFPMTAFPMGAHARAPDEAAAMGAALVFGRTGRPQVHFDLHHGTDDAIRLAEGARASVLYGVAGFVRRVLMRAAEIDADLRALRLAMITGEATSRAMREDMRRRMAALGCADTRVVNRYGSTEQGASMAECVEGSGFHNLAPHQVFHEILDPDTGERLAEGETGALAFTHLDRRGTVLLRYLVGDRAALDTRPCPHCGRSTPRVASDLSRAGDIVKLRGMAINLRVLRDWLERRPEVEEYQIVLRGAGSDDPLGPDELVLRLALAGDAGTAARLVEEVRALTHLRPAIELAARDAIFDPAREAKPRRVADLRDRG